MENKRLHKLNATLKLRIDIDQKDSNSNFAKKLLIIIKISLFNFYISKLVSASDIAVLTSQRNEATAAQIATIANQTQKTLANLQATYKTSIQTSSEFILI